MTSATALARHQRAIWLTLMLLIGLLNGCAHETITGQRPMPNADDRLGPMN